MNRRRQTNRGLNRGTDEQTDLVHPPPRRGRRQPLRIPLGFRWLPTSNHGGEILLPLPFPALPLAPPLPLPFPYILSLPLCSPPSLPPRISDRTSLQQFSWPRRPPRAGVGVPGVSRRDTFAVFLAGETSPPVSPSKHSSSAAWLGAPLPRPCPRLAWAFGCKL